MNAFQLFILFATALLTANGQNEISQQNIGIPDSFGDDLGSGAAQSTGFVPQQNIGVPENFDDDSSAQQQVPQHSGQSDSLGQSPGSRGRPRTMPAGQRPSNFEPQQNIGVPENLDQLPNLEETTGTTGPTNESPQDSDSSDSLGQSATRPTASSQTAPEQTMQLPKESSEISPRAMPAKQKSSNFEPQQNIGVPENLDNSEEASMTTGPTNESPQDSDSSDSLGQSATRPTALSQTAPQQNMKLPKSNGISPRAMPAKQKPSNFEPQQNIGIPENLDESPDAGSVQQQVPQHSGRSDSLGQSATRPKPSRGNPTAMAFKQGPSNFVPQQNIGVPDNLDESSMPEADPMTTEPAEQNSEMSDSLGQSATRPMPSSQSQKSPKQNNQTPNSRMSPKAMPQKMNAPGNLAKSPGARMGPMSMSANQMPSSFFPQRNIGIPDNFEETPDTGSGMGLSGFVPQRKISGPGASSPSGFGPSNFVPQRKIGTPNSFNEYPVPDGEVSVGVGNGQMIPLAVNTKHMIQYVDTPSTYSMMDLSSGSSLGGSRSRSGSYPSQQPISQQKIGIPNSPARSGGRKFPSNGNRYGNGGSSGSRTHYGGGSGGGGGGQVIQLPVISRHTVQYVDVPSSGQAQPITVEIPATRMGVSFNFKTGSNLRVSQSHQGSPGSYQETSSVDEPIRMSHTVRRPIIQETRQNIQPYRMVTQSIQPVQENIHTIVAVDANRMRGGYSNGGHSGQGSSLGGGYSRGPSNFGRGAKNRPSYNSNQLGSGYSRGGGNRRFYDGSYGKGQQKLGNW